MALVNYKEHLLLTLQIVELGNVITILQTGVLKVGVETHNVVELVFLKS